VPAGVRVRRRQERVLLTAEEVAKALNVGRCTVYDLIRTGQLRSFKIGKLRRIPVDAVHEFARRMLDDSDDSDDAA
jgi:excisionase family DNA binding protein